MTSDELDRCLVHMNGAFRALISGPDAILAARGLGRAHHRALFVLRRESPIAVGDLARALEVSVQALHKTLQPLVRKQLVKPVAAPDDRRVRMLSLTPAGAALEKQISGMQREVFAVVADTLGAKALATWSASMVEIARQSRLAFGSADQEAESRRALS